LPEREEKPRRSGITAIMDMGIPVGELRYILEAYGTFCDLAKLGVGSAYIEPLLKKKLKTYHSYGIPVYFGGTLFEKYYNQGKFNDYLEFMDDVGISCIEISNGTIDIAPDEIVRLVEIAARHFDVIAEIGKKDRNRTPKVEEWITWSSEYVKAGCRYVVLEGRNSGDIGIYNSRGELLEPLIREISRNININQIIFEAPNSKCQHQLINLLGSNVNLGNVSLKELLLLETLRNGLKKDTFFIDTS
jgi:phosphosulfolactate synthase